MKNAKVDAVDFGSLFFLGIIIVYIGFVIRTCVIAESILPIIIAVFAWYGCIGAGAGVCAMVGQFKEIWSDNGIFSKIFAVLLPGSFAIIFLVGCLLAGYIALGITGLFQPVLDFMLS